MSDFRDKGPYSVIAVVKIGYLNLNSDFNV